jgi:hypothetical protein
MTQPTSSSRLSNLSLNIIGADGSIANYGNTGINETGNFDISANGTLTLGSTGNVTIGNTNGTVNITNGAVNLNTINGPTGGSILRIGQNLVAGSLFLGGTAGSTVTIGGTGNRIFLGTTGGTAFVNGTLFSNGDLVANTIKSSDATTAMTIGGNITNSTIKIGQFTTGGAASVHVGNTSGTSSNALYGSSIQIGNPSSTVNIGVTGTINVTSSSIQIGTGMKSGSISIGDTSFPTGIFASALTLGGAGSNVVIGSTGSQIYIGATGSTAYINGTVFIGASGSGNVSLGNTALGTTTINSNAVNIGTGSTGPAGIINLGNVGANTGSTVNIGVGATAVNIGTGSTGAVTIGNANGVTKFNGPLTLGSAPTSTGHLGYNIASFTSGASTISVPAIISITPSGIFLVTGVVQMTNSSGTNVNANLYLRHPQGYNIGFSNVYYDASFGFCQSASFTYIAVSTGSYSLSFSALGGTNTATIQALVYSYSYVRIA